MHYWRPDNYHNEVVLYPHPVSPSLQGFPTAADVFAVEGATVGTYIVGTSKLITSDDDELDTGDTGMMIDVVTLDDAFFCVYEPIPTPVDDTTSKTDWPDWIVPAVEYATLERAYGADSDGFIPSLRDYWAMRKEAAIQALRRFKRARLNDREFVIGRGLEKSNRSRARLPAGYPAIWP
jgi:hypothetical protein